MVCKKCEKKVSTLATPEVWKKSENNTIGSSAGAPQLGVNKLIQKRKHNYGFIGAKPEKC